ncbi:hypothetical protein AcW1_007991 [Taiwanofungus camphoratus]|nr:hypothetical protein AcV5_008285 [Antrodia cinnamomea]KAI0950771.1 hypothetical protein AcW1_007991 [Antrodia cinnamomea]KAI0955681.1 hypothetical protein AcV7_006280 [Antrodia cinnamomea]
MALHSIRILYMLMGPLQERGYHVLRYNSRGVGKSSGWPSLTGMREVQDLKELIQWALAYISSVVSVVVIGYSYGALIASLLPALPGLRISHVLLSYPLGPRHWLTAFHGKAYTKALITLINNNRSNVLLLYGDCDEFTPAESYDAWAHKLVQETEGGQQGRLKIVKIDSGTHFWRESDCARRLIETIEQWLP